MKFLAFSALTFLVSSATCSPLLQRQTASPPSIPSDKLPSYTHAADLTIPFPIHESCNITLRRQLEHALDETAQLAYYAKRHLLLHGLDSLFVNKYFGNHSTATAIGWYDRILSASKFDVLFRCDDPDKNCATQDGWAGHWRGSNATQETVICPLSFSRRRHLDSVCGLGYTVAESPLNTFWATDLMHRIFHIPRVSEGAVDHFADDYEGVLALAKSDPAKSSLDSDTLQYFAIDVYAYDVAAPGMGCSGVKGDNKAKPSTTAPAPPTSTTTSAAASCHTHADGVVHCD